jgi:hypothetical protein
MKTIVLEKTEDFQEPNGTSVDACTLPGCACGLVYLRFHKTRDTVFSILPLDPEGARLLGQYLIEEAEKAEAFMAAGAVRH